MTLLTGPQKGKHGHNVHLANSIFVPVRSSGFLGLHRCRCIANCLIAETFLYAPCLVYLPTFWWFLGQMLVNIPAPWSIWDLYGFIIECIDPWLLEYDIGVLPSVRSMRVTHGYTYSISASCWFIHSLHIICQSSAVCADQTTWFQSVHIVDRLVPESDRFVGPILSET